MKQRQRWPAELRAAIDAADAEGIPPNRILALAKSGDLDGITQRFDLPQSTFFDILAKVRQSRLSASEPVAPGDEEQAAGTILRRALEIAKRELAKVDAALNDPRKTASERATLLKQLDTLQRMVRSYENKAASVKGSGQKQTEAAGARTRDARSDPLRDFVRDVERRAASDNGSRHEPAPQTQGNDVPSSA